MPFPSLFRGRTKSIVTAVDEGGGNSGGSGAKLSLSSVVQKPTNRNYQGCDDPSLSFSLDDGNLSATEAAIVKGRQQAHDDSSASQEQQPPKALPRPSMAGDALSSSVADAVENASSMRSASSGESNSHVQQPVETTKKQLPRPSMAGALSPNVKEAVEHASSFHSAASIEADAAAGRRSSRTSRTSDRSGGNRRKSRSKSRNSLTPSVNEGTRDGEDGRKKKKKKDRARSKSKHRSKSRSRSKSKAKKAKEGQTDDEGNPVAASSTTTGDIPTRSSRSKSRTRSKSIQRQSTDGDGNDDRAPVTKRRSQSSKSTAGSGGGNGVDEEKVRRRERSKSRSRIEFERARNRERSKSRTRKDIEKQQQKQQEREEQKDEESTSQFKSDDSCSTANAASQLGAGGDINGNSTGLYLQLDFLAAGADNSGGDDKQVANLGVSQNFAVDNMEECSVTSELTEMSESSASTSPAQNKSTVPTALSAPAPSKPKSAANRLQAYSNMGNTRNPTTPQATRSSAPRAAVAAIQNAETRRTKTTDASVSPAQPSPIPTSQIQSPRRSATLQPGIDLNELSTRSNTLKKLAQETIEQHEEHDTEMEERIKDLLSKAKAKYLANRERQAIRYMKKVQRAKATLATISDAIDELEEISESIDCNIRRLGLLHAVKRSSFDVVAAPTKLSASSRSIRHVEDDSIDSSHRLPDESEASDVISIAVLSSHSDDSGGGTSAVTAKINQNNLEIARTIHEEIGKAERNILEFIRRAALTSANEDDGEQVDGKDTTEGDDSSLLKELAKLVEQD